MTTWQLYWITRLDNVVSFFDFVTALFCFVLILIGGIWLLKTLDDDMNEEEKKEFNKIMWKYFFRGLIISSIFIIIDIFIPTQKDILTIYSAEWATNSAEVKKLPDNTVKAINKLLGDYIKNDKNK